MDARAELIALFKRTHEETEQKYDIFEILIETLHFGCTSGVRQNLDEMLKKGMLSENDHEKYISLANEICVTEADLEYLLRRAISKNKQSTPESMGEAARLGAEYAQFKFILRCLRNSDWVNVQYGFQTIAAGILGENELLGFIDIKVAEQGG